MNPNGNIIEALTKARDLIAAPGGWIQFGIARDAMGGGVLPTSPEAVCFCSLGAIANAVGDAYGAKVGPASLWLVQVIGGNIQIWNDDPEQTQTEVVAAFDAAIALAVADENRDRPAH